ncbi:hypothetical protein [Pseudobdellovibrio sp. HCB154]|uniref:hypothetical protein n=1 Tax=Pseudobdellovibrio sp. HCB154 TaxID=3386277 RepID=UPI0039171787
MKTLSLALKTITVGLTLASSVSFAADASSGKKYVNRDELMAILTEGGLPNGEHLGKVKNSESESCVLTVNTTVGQEKLAMKLSTQTDLESQQFNFSDEYEYPLNEVTGKLERVSQFRITENPDGISINQDFSDSSQDVMITKTKNSVEFTFTELGAGDNRSLTCVIK